MLEAGPRLALQASAPSRGYINGGDYLSPMHHRLRVARMAAHRRLGQDLGADPWDWPGCLKWDDAAGLAALAAALADPGHAALHFGRAAVAALEPAPVGAPAQALLYAQGGAVAAAALTRALLAGALLAGALLAGALLAGAASAGAQCGSGCP